MTQPEIEAFLAVIQQGTVTAAAESLYITQPALSRRLRALEEELGCALFERGKGSRFAALTREGEAFVAVADKLRHVHPGGAALLAGGVHAIQAALCFLLDFTKGLFDSIRHTSHLLFPRHGYGLCRTDSIT